MARRPRALLDESFRQFHEANPWVYVTLVRLARTAKQHGQERYGIAALFEVMRWERLMQTRHNAGDFKLNNNHRALYARLIMNSNPDLAGFFELRRRSES